MATGAKKGEGKQAGMTEEENLLWMQQRAQAKEEMAQKKVDTLTQFLKEKLQKEERNSAVNVLKLTERWRAVLRQTRAAELRGNIAVLSQTFERVLDRKDSVIKCLVCDLSEAEQQSSQARRSHLQGVDRLQALQTRRLASLEQQWSSSLEGLSSEFNSEREQVLAQNQQECAYLEDVNFAMEQYYSEVDSEARHDHQSTKDDIKNKTIEEKHLLRIQLEGTVEGLWRQFVQAHRSYNEATEDRHIAFESLRGRDQRSTEEIDTQMRRLQKMQDSISALRSRLNSSQRESEGAARSLRLTREEATLQTRQLKAQLSRARAAKRTQLVNLTVHSNAAAKNLQAVVAKGERLLRLGEMCRKLETEHEKVLPFYTSSLTTEEQSLERANAKEPPSEELAKAMQDYSVMDRFWQRYNKVRLEQMCLERERGALTRENLQLQSHLRQYLDGISVNDAILRHRNPLLMVSQATLAVPATIVPPSCPSADAQRRRHTVIEAAHVARRTL